MGFGWFFSGGWGVGVWCGSCDGELGFGRLCFWRGYLESRKILLCFCLVRVVVISCICMQVRGSGSNGSGSNSSSNKASSPDDDQVTGLSTLAAACVMCPCCFLCVHAYLNLATPSTVEEVWNGELYFLVLVCCKCMIFCGLVVMLGVGECRPVRVCCTHVVVLTAAELTSKFGAGLTEKKNRWIKDLFGLLPQLATGCCKSLDLCLDGFLSSP